MPETPKHRKEEERCTEEEVVPAAECKKTGSRERKMELTTPDHAPRVLPPGIDPGHVAK